ncbi:MAG: hypothetical protein LPK14_08250 [Hymenobacteraceae bacterium]|nr:hypothetical protein [Hymenobacteraceae bacterium]
MVKEWPSSGCDTKLSAFNEKDLPIYNQVPEQKQWKADGAVVVDKRFFLL